MYLSRRVVVIVGLEFLCLSCVVVVYLCLSLFVETGSHHAAQSGLEFVIFLL